MVSWMLILTHTISRKIMIRRFDLACGCSSKKNIHRLVVVLRTPKLLGGVMDYMKRKNCKNKYEKQVRKIIFIER